MNDTSQRPIHEALQVWTDALAQAQESVTTALGVLPAFDVLWNEQDQEDFLYGDALERLADQAGELARNIEYVATALPHLWATHTARIDAGRPGLVHGLRWHSDTEYHRERFARPSSPTRT